MSRVVRAVVGVALVAVGVLTGNFALVISGLSLVGNALLAPSAQRPDRFAAQTSLQIGEVARGAVFGRAAVGGSLVDAFNYGGEDNTDWEVLVIALADHQCDALEGFYVDDAFVPFVADGQVAGYNGQLFVEWRDGSWDQNVPTILTLHGPGWTANDRGRGVCHVVVAYQADNPEAENPVWPGGRPRFRWVLRGARCYDPRLDSTAGGAGAHRRDVPTTWSWTENPIVARYNWVRGMFAGHRTTQPEMLLVGRGLSAIEAPPENVFARANLCDEMVGGAARYRIGGQVSADETFLAVEEEFAAACAGTISQPEGSVEIDPGEARAPVASFTDDDLIVGSRATWSDFLGTGDDGWVNTVVATFVDPTQGWIERSAPPRREIADIVADKGPREVQLSLPMVTDIGQAGRVAEIWRRLGRIWGRGQVTLPPRFAGIEEGDWVNWTSQRRFGGATKTFRVEAWGSDEGWRHQLTLREIAASAYIDTAAPADTAIAVQQAPPPALAAPDIGDWTLTGTAVSGVNGSVPALRLDGGVTRSSASAVRVEYRLTGTADWTRHADLGRTATAIVITGLAYATGYEVSVQYLVDGVYSPRRVLGPVTTGAISAGGTGVRRILSRSVQFPLSSNDNSISITAFTGVIDDGSTVSFPAVTIGGRASGVNYAVFYNPVAGIYFAIVSPALAQFADPALIYLGLQATSSGGSYTPPPTPPGGGAGDGTAIP